MTMESRDYSPVDVTGEHPNDDASETLFQSRRCCFCFSWSTSATAGSSAPALNWWQSIRPGGESAGGDGSLWARGVGALMKLREWSEIVAGPRWKTFIRRFNRNGVRRSSSQNCRYDPLSYALNFDEGPGQNGDFEGEEDYRLRNFSVRYASVPAAASAKGSMDLGRDGPSFV